MADFSIREGTTDEIVLQLKADGTVISLASVDHIVLKMKDSAGKIYTYSSGDGSPIFTVSDAANGKVQLVPTSTIFYATRSPYKLYVQVYDSATSHYSVPEDSEIELEVRRVF